MNIQNRRDVYGRYLEAWSAVTEEHRVRLLEACASPGIVYHFAGGTVEGRNNLFAHLTSFQRNKPSYSFSLENFMTHNADGLANWAMRDPDGAMVVRGYDVVHFGANDCMESIVGFSDIASQTGK